MSYMKAGISMRARVFIRAHALEHALERATRVAAYRERWSMPNVRGACRRMGALFVAWDRVA